MYSKQDIERYILEQMDADEKNAFKAQLGSDDTLKQEVKAATEAILERMDTMVVSSGELATEAIQRYIRKEMSQSETQALENEAKDDPILAYLLKVQTALSREVRLHSAAEMLKNRKASARVVDFTHILKSVTPIAVAACMVCGCIIWDHNVTVNVGNEAYSSVMRGGSEIDNLILQEKYKEAIELIDQELSISYSIVGEEAIAAYNQEMNNLRYTKAVVLLKDGKKRQAKKILKQLNDERSNELLDKLLW
jgi:hypothetical protein